MNGRSADGTFANGNAGRPKGARNKATQAVLALLEGEAEALSRKAVELALAGDSVALRLCLDRIAPPRKDSPVQFAIPRMTTAHDATQAAGGVLEAVADGELTPAEGAQVMALVDSFRRVLETSELELRVAALEGQPQSRLSL
jgi:hypothetical protein